MSTRADIIKLADGLLRQRGYNAFSFTDISSQLNIKNASVHYHFPTKPQLAIALIHEHKKLFEQLTERSSALTPLQKLKAFLSVYSTAKSQRKICVVGTLTTDLYTVEKEVAHELKILVNIILETVIKLLDEGRRKKVFFYSGATRTKALLIITNMMAAVQLTRITGQADFEAIQKAIITDLTTKK